MVMENISTYSVDKDRICWRRVERETVVLDIDSGHYYTLDSTAGALWDMVVSGKSEGQMVSSILGGYSIDEKTAREDIRRFINRLKEEKLILKK